MPVRCNGNAIHIEIESHAIYEERNTYVMKLDFVLISLDTSCSNSYEHEL
jgi:hypothetical protein